MVTANGNKLTFGDKNVSIASINSNTKDPSCELSLNKEHYVLARVRCTDEFTQQEYTTYNDRSSFIRSAINDFATSITSSDLF